MSIKLKSFRIDLPHHWTIAPLVYPHFVAGGGILGFALGFYEGTFLAVALMLFFVAITWLIATLMQPSFRVVGEELELIDFLSQIANPTRKALHDLREFRVTGKRSCLVLTFRDGSRLIGGSRVPEEQLYDLLRDHLTPSSVGKESMTLRSYRWVPFGWMLLALPALLPLSASGYSVSMSLLVSFSLSFVASEVTKRLLILSELRHSAA